MILSTFPPSVGFPDDSVGKESACNARRSWLNSWVGKIPWRRDGLATPVFLGFPCGSADKESVCNAGDLDLISGLGRYLLLLSLPKFNLQVSPYSFFFFLLESFPEPFIHIICFCFPLFWNTLLLFTRTYNGYSDAGIASMIY